MILRKFSLDYGYQNASGVIFVGNSLAYTKLYRKSKTKRIYVYTWHCQYRENSRPLTMRATKLQLGPVYMKVADPR